MKVIEAEQVEKAVEEIRRLLYDAMEVALDIGISAEFAKDMYVSTREAESVRHGKNISEKGFLCSECSFGDFGGFRGYEPNYCPSCGAKMDKE